MVPNFRYPTISLTSFEQMIKTWVLESKNFVVDVIGPFSNCAMPERTPSLSIDSENCLNEMVFELSRVVKYN